MVAVLEFDPVKPVGSRTCCDLPKKSNAVQHNWLDADVPEYVQETSDLMAGDLDPKLTYHQHLDALGVLRSLKARAAKGQLPLGDGGTSPAKVMQRVDYIIELRPKLSSGVRAPRLFRLYYAEPKSVVDALLPLVLSTKPNGADVLNEQNVSIDDAQARSRVWALGKR